MLETLKTDIGLVSRASKRLALTVAAIERTANGDAEAAAICAQLLNTIGEFRDRLSTIRLDPIRRVVQP
jgi:hypothetical protein